MKLYATIFAFVLTFLGGFAYGSLANYVGQVTTCGNMSGWTSYIGISEENELRCFFVEDRFPRRIKQGKI